MTISQPNKKHCNYVKQFQEKWLFANKQHSEGSCNHLV